MKIRIAKKILKSYSPHSGIVDFMRKAGGHTDQQKYKAYFIWLSRDNRFFHSSRSIGVIRPLLPWGRFTDDYLKRKRQKVKCGKLKGEG